MKPERGARSGDAEPGKPRATVAVRLKVSDMGDPRPGNEIGTRDPEPSTGVSEVGRPAEGSSRGWKVGGMGEGRKGGLGNKGFRAPHPG